MANARRTKIPRVVEADHVPRETSSTRLIHSITQALPEAGISTVSPDRNELIFVPHLSTFLYTPLFLPLTFLCLFSLILSFSPILPFPFIYEVWLPGEGKNKPRIPIFSQEQCFYCHYFKRKIDAFSFSFINTIFHEETTERAYL